MLEKSLVATLRLHSSNITCMEPFYVPSTLTCQLNGVENSNENNGKAEAEAEILEFPIFNPTLITADESGLIIWWNLSTRRPLGLWKAHEGSILSMKQLGITWTETNDDNDNSDKFSIPHMNMSIYGKLQTHSKDGTIKIWNLINLIKKDDLNSGFVYSTLLKKKPCDQTAISPPKVFELPVNVLNFTNVDFNNNTNLLITPATTDSEGYDIYKINLDEKIEEFKKLRRLIQNFKPPNHLNQEFDNESDITKRAGYGVIMKIKWIDDNKFVVGYENGSIIGYQIKDLICDNDNNINNSNNSKIEILFENNDLIGNSITSIEIGMNHNHRNLLCTSTGSKIVIINISNFDAKTFETKHKGINDIKTDIYTNSVVFITWDGYTRFYEYNDESILKFVMKMRKQIPSISNSKELNSDDISSSNNLQTQRANILQVTTKQMDPNNKLDNNKILYNNGRSKNVIKHNREEIFGKRWLFVGFQDGKIAMYSVS